MYFASTLPSLFYVSLVYIIVLFRWRLFCRALFHVTLPPVNRRTSCVIICLMVIDSLSLTRPNGSSADYYIVLDEIFTERKVAPPHQNAADVLEDLTHSMCYLFGRATKAVSICPPAYYADIICERARCYLSGLFDMATPSATPAQSVVGEGVLGEPRAEDVLIHPNLRNTMFYI